MIFPLPGLFVVLHTSDFIGPILTALIWDVAFSGGISIFLLGNYTEVMRVPRASTFTDSTFAGARVSWFVVHVFVNTPLSSNTAYRGNRLVPTDKYHRLPSRVSACSVWRMLPESAPLCCLVWVEFLWVSISSQGVRKAFSGKGLILSRESALPSRWWIIDCHRVGRRPLCQEPFWARKEATTFFRPVLQLSQS